MEIEQQKDENICKLKHSLNTSAAIPTEPQNSRLRKFVKQLPRLMVRDNVLYRKFYAHNGDYRLQTVVPEHLELELMCRIHDQLHHAGMQNVSTNYDNAFIFQTSTRRCSSILRIV